MYIVPKRFLWELCNWWVITWGVISDDSSMWNIDSPGMVRLWLPVWLGIPRHISHSDIYYGPKINQRYERLNRKKHEIWAFEQEKARLWAFEQEKARLLSLNVTSRWWLNHGENEFEKSGLIKVLYEENYYEKTQFHGRNTSLLVVKYNFRHNLCINTKMFYIYRIRRNKGFNSELTAPQLAAPLINLIS